MPPPPPPTSVPHLLDLSPSDTLPDHDPLPPSNARRTAAAPTLTTAAAPGIATTPEDNESECDYPDRSTYQQLPDSPGSSYDPFGSATLHHPHPAPPLPPIDPIPAPAPSTETGNAVELVADDNSDEDSAFDIEAIRREYKRSGSHSVVGRGYVRRDIGVVRRQPTPPKILSDLPRFVNHSVAVAASPRENIPGASSSQQPPLPTTRPLHRQPNPALDDNDEDQIASDDKSESISEVSTLSSASMDEEESWISSFCNVVGHEYFAEVAEDFIEDDFNLTGLGAVVPMYKEALEMILDVEPEDDSDSLGSASESLSGDPAAYRRRSGHQRTASDYSVIETSAELLYGLIHQRFITSRQGIQVMYEKYLANHFGFCPRVNCNSARVLPCGYSDQPGTETVKLFCPSCCDIYVPPNSRFQSVDGAYFGTTFPSLFLMTFPELDVSGNGRPRELTASNSLNSAGGRRGSNNTQPPINGVPANNIAPGLGKGKRYEMKIYGFRVNERARSGPRMGWLRDKPENLTILDEYGRFGGDGETIDSEEEVEHSEIDDEEEEDEDEEMVGGPTTTKRAAASGPVTRSNRKGDPIGTTQ